MMAALLCASPVWPVAPATAETAAVDNACPPHGQAATPHRARARRRRREGCAHVGVLGVLEELRIPIDCIVGTSMGALVGGTFASAWTRRNSSR